MKNLFIFSILFIQISILAQSFDELDETYLDSLPDGVKKDVTDRIKNKKETEKPFYRKASTMIDKDNYELKDKEEDENLEDKYKDEIFGKKFFDTMQTTFMPLNEPNFDSTYVLDYGDVLKIQLIGQVNSDEIYEIERDGSITIEDLGKIFLSGLTLEEATKLIKIEVANTFIGTNAFSTLTNIRDVQVVITGNAYNPGIYTLSGNSNILHALTMAGGIDDNGSYRKIELIRNNQVIESLDLYELFVYGLNSVNTRLRTGDSILVSSRLNTVNILSGVNRPSLYEMKNGETFADLIKLSNGISPNADIEFIQLQRIENNDVNIIPLKLEDLESKLIKNNDSLSIKEFKYGSVKISGAVKIPGNYKIISGDTLSKLILRAGGYEDYAYPFGGFLNNESSIKINKEARERLYEQFLKYLIDNAGMSSSAGGSNEMSLPLILKELREVEDVGRVIAEFNLDVIKAEPELDTILEDGDEIIIPNLTQQVYIYGEVNNQGATRYASGKNIAEYISRSGGFLTSADKDTIFIVHPNGETQSFSNINRLAFNSFREQIPVFPGSIIYVPRKSSVGGNLRSAAVWAPVLSSLALSIASISSINN